MSIDVNLRFKNTYYLDCFVVNIIKSKYPYVYDFELITRNPCEYIPDEDLEFI